MVFTKNSWYFKHKKNCNCFRCTHISPTEGKHHSQETKDKMSNIRNVPINIIKSIQNLPKNTKGENNGRWFGGIIYFRGPDWKEIRIKVWQRDGFKCQICGVANCKVVAHHKVPYRISLDNSLNNLTTLCLSCHQKEENILQKVYKGVKIY